jgi:predicted CXXCH cytochrome family protein
VLTARFALLPRTLVDAGVNQAAAVQREMVEPVAFAGTAVCQDCHDDVAGRRRGGFHKNVGCETCHGPAVRHTEDPGATKPTLARDRKLCVVCHAYDASRPTGFPQINPVAHNPLRACVTCHNPHDPKPPQTPRGCAACHAQIERTKAVSSHALLACTTCHNAPERHRTAPRTVLPSKPETREFCAGCHGQDAKTKDAPKVDLATHGGNFLCWQCHYPHLPGGRT